MIDAPTAQLLIDRLDRIEALLKSQSVTNETHTTSPHDTISRKEVGAMLGCKSEAARSRRIKALGIVPFAHGLYRRGDVSNAIARASLRAQKQGRVAA